MPDSLTPHAHPLQPMDIVPASLGATSKPLRPKGVAPLYKPLDAAALHSSYKPDVPPLPYSVLD